MTVLLNSEPFTCWLILYMQIQTKIFTKNHFLKKNLFFYVHWGFACICVRMTIPQNWSYSCELPCECWELNLCPLEEQLVSLNLQPFLYLTFKCYSRIFFKTGFHYSLDLKTHNPASVSWVYHAQFNLKYFVYFIQALKSISCLHVFYKIKINSLEGLLRTRTDIYVIKCWLKGY